MYRVSLRSGLAAIVALTFCQDLRASCSALPNLESEFEPKYLIAQGSNANYGRFPWMVLIQQPMGDVVRRCGGSIITARWILTAAHCIEKPPRSFIVSFGEIDKRRIIMNESPGVTMKTSQGAIHPKYHAGGSSYDIGLLKTPEKIPFNDYIQPIRLAGIEEMHKNYANMDGLIAGWGMDTKWGRLTRNLKFGHQRIMSNSECRRFGLYIGDNTVCTSTETASIACEGDSGGPLMVYDGNELVQIGVLSASLFETCVSYSPNLSRRTTSFNDWIKDVTGVQY